MSRFYKIHFQRSREEKLATYLIVTTYMVKIKRLPMTFTSANDPPGFPGKIVMPGTTEERFGNVDIN
jgi:hypothetical protein